LLARPALLHHPSTGVSATMNDEELPKRKVDIVIGENLAAVSVAELEHRISVLDSEIHRIRAEIAKKQASKAAAATFFRT
jgi:uncharacterized small protein (DUF1192 family)